MAARTDLHDDAGHDPVGRRFAKIAVTALAIGAFATAGLSGALAQMDDDDGVFGSGGSGGSGVFGSGGSGDDGVFGDDFPGSVFPSGIFDDDEASGGSGNINVGGSSGSNITMGGSGGGISIGDDDNSGHGGGGNSGHRGGDDLYDD